MIKTIRGNEDLDLNELNGGNLSLFEWKIIIDDLISKYGNNAIIVTDSGGNACQFTISVKED